MPELPEVETIRRTLQQLVVGKTISAIEVMWPRIIQHPDDVEQFRLQLIGQRIQSIGRRGKFLLFHLTEDTLVSHLRMEGNYRVVETGTEKGPHTHVVLQFSDGTSLYYTDVRKFGTMHVFPHEVVHDQLPLRKLGPEPLTKELTLEYFLERVQATTRSIKAVLLDQTVVAGLGNIYVDEALFRSGIHPETKANSLDEERITKLLNAIDQTISEAVEKGGSTVRTYVNSEGEMGMFQLSHNVYGRQGEPCKVCGSPIERLVVAGRGTHICPNCQE